MQVSWQAQRFVKLEVQILSGNLFGASKPKSHPGRLCIELLIKLVSKIENTSRSKGSSFSSYKKFFKIVILH